MDLKRAVANFWDSGPCGAGDARGLEEGSRAFFDLIESIRYDRDDFIPRLVNFKAWNQKRVLEVGCGIGTDCRQFARSGAAIIGVDVSLQSARLAKKALETYGFEGTVMNADGEHLPFADHAFDLVYSWGVIHHSPEPEKVVSEIHRVLKPGGEVIAMLYNVQSIFALQLWVYYALLRGRPFMSPRSLISGNIESPETKAYSRGELIRLFDRFQQLSIQPVVTGYDLRIGRRLFLPKWLRRVVPQRFGWFALVRGHKPASV